MEIESKLEHGVGASRLCLLPASEHIPSSFQVGSYGDRSTDELRVSGPRGVLTSSTDSPWAWCTEDHLQAQDLGFCSLGATGPQGLEYEWGAGWGQKVRRSNCSSAPVSG